MHPNDSDPNASTPSGLNLDKNTNAQAQSQPTAAPPNHPTHNDSALAQMRQFTLIMYIMYMVGLVTGIASLIGVIMAYVKRDEAQNTPYADHFTFLIRTFWISFGASVVGFLTTPILIGFLILPLVFVWYIYRCVVGFIKFNDNKPIDPLTWF